MICTKPFSITIAPNEICPDWTTLLWDAPIIIGESPPDATGSFTPNGIAGENYHAQAQCADFFTGLFIVQASVEANLIYNGNGCDCQVTVNWNGTGADPTEAIASIRVQQNGGDILPIQNFDTTNNGNYTFGFNLLDTGGGNQNINVRIVWQVSNLVGGGPSTADMQGTFSNVP